MCIPSHPFSTFHHAHRSRIADGVKILTSLWKNTTRIGTWPLESNQEFVTSEALRYAYELFLWKIFHPVCSQFIYSLQIILATLFPPSEFSSFFWNSDLAAFDCHGPPILWDAQCVEAFATYFQPLDQRLVNWVNWSLHYVESLHSQCLGSSLSLKLILR